DSKVIFHYRQEQIPTIRGDPQVDSSCQNMQNESLNDLILTTEESVPNWNSSVEIPHLNISTEE
ncbi:hypothetical protein HAX54_012599, partial [Datura stramonium]|nr:hypothetical protein [Datura stramonium]